MHPALGTSLPEGNNSLKVVQRRSIEMINTKGRTWKAGLKTQYCSCFMNRTFIGWREREVQTKAWSSKNISIYTISKALTLEKCDYNPHIAKGELQEESKIISCKLKSLGIMSLNYYRNFDLTYCKFSLIARSQKLGITSPKKGKVRKKKYCCWVQASFDRT